jgi:two-component system NtrC family sensor kinase
MTGASSDPPQDEAGRGAVLVVDDVEANLTAMSALLSGLNCDIVLARSGNEALLCLLRREFAVMLLDVQMPEMDGYEVATYARANAATRDVPIVFLTAGGVASRGLGGGRAGRLSPGQGSADENLLRGYGSGAVDFLFKPVDATILRSKVRVFLELDRRRRQLVRARNELEIKNRALHETAREHAALAERFQKANVELQEAYHDLKTAQTGLVQAAKMASLGELVAGIAHEINNPLSFCLSHVETIKRCLAATESRAPETFADSGTSQHWQRALSRLGQMKLGLTRISELVVKLRTFSRLDEGEMKRVHVKECIDSVLTILSHRLQPRIAVDLDCSPHERIDCNPALLNQALMNLISNAIDAIAGEGRIKICCTAAGGQYQIVVEDNGSGIPADVRERIFEPFFTTKPVGLGTGLGLSIAYSIVKKHNGTLHAEDAPGGGTRMLISLPQQSAVEGMSDPAPESLPESAPESLPDSLDAPRLALEGLSATRGP